MSKIITCFFTGNGIPSLGLSPTITIYQLTYTTVPVSTAIITGDPLTEIGGGLYRYDFLAYDSTQNYVFTVDGGGTLSNFDRYKYGGNDSYAEDITSTVLDEPTTSHVQSGSVGLAISATQANSESIVVSEITITTLLNTLLKYQRNRTKIDTTAKQLIIYDDDATTPILTFNLLDLNGMPSVAEVIDRVPVL